MNEPTNAQQALQRLDDMTPQRSESASALLNVIARAAKDPAVDVEKMERLMALQERVLAKEAESAFSAAMQDAQAKMPLIRNDSRNDSTNSSYAKLKTVNKLVVPVYTEHGFSLSFGTADCPVPNHIRVTCKVRHRGGHSQDYQCDVPMDTTGPKGLPNKTLTHGFGSSLSYGRRYLTMLIFNVSTTDDDDGQRAGGSADAESVTSLAAKLWAAVQPVCNGDKTWKTARRFLTDECQMDPEKRVQDLDAAELRALIETAKARMKELGIV